MFAAFGKALGIGLVIATLAAAVPARAQDRDVQQRLEQLQRQVEELRRELGQRDTTETAVLRRQIEAITRELEEMRLGRDVAVEADTSILGFGPAAAKVYKVQQGVSIGGYGEVLYENFAAERENNAPSGASDRFDALRAIVYVGYKFNDRLLFNSELEWEHGSTSQGGEASIEFAYLDYMLTPNFGLRGGLLLPPMGLVNELHEPPIFLGTTRPATEQAIIPSTWRANGIGVFGQAGEFAYRAYLVNSFDGVGGGSSRASGFSASGLRGGRQKGARAVAEDFALIGRMDYVGTPGLTAGGSAHWGETAQNRTLASGQEVGGRTIIYEGHLDYRARGLDVRALFASAHVDEAAGLNELKELTGSKSIGERLSGGYVHAGYNVLRTADTEHQLLPYIRYERLNTQQRVPTGFSADPATDRQIFVLGAMWKPIANISVKADYEIHSNQANTGVNQFNVNLGYLF